VREREAVAADAELLDDSNGISGVVARAFAGPATFWPIAGPAASMVVKMMKTKLARAPRVMKASLNAERRRGRA